MGNMNKRKVFLLFLSAMSVSIVVMIIVYGLFIKDLNFSFNVKNPDMAPSPMDEEGGIDDEYRSRARIMSPEEIAKQEEADKAEEDTDPDLAPVEEDEPEVTEVTPLNPSVGREDERTIVPPTPQAAENTGMPTLHFVYLDGFSSRDAAEQAMGHLQSRPLVARPYIRQHNGQIILQFGVFSDRENAEAMAQQLRNQQVFVKVD